MLLNLAAATLLTISASSPPLPFQIAAPPVATATITSEYNDLPACVQGHIASSSLRLVKVVKHGKLGFITVDGELYYKQAESFTPSGYLMLIDVNFVSNPNIVLHEFGHWFDDFYLSKSFGKAWKVAVAADYDGLTKKQKYDNEYLKDPHEAAAEIFASQMVQYEGLTGKNEYDTGLFHRSNALMAQILAQACS